jgi:hypothetical protein
MRCGQIPGAPEQGFIQSETGSFFRRNREFIYPNRELLYSRRAKYRLPNTIRKKGGSMTEQLTPESFLPHVDKTFRVKGGRHALKLDRVEVPSNIAGFSRQPFNLIFSGPPGDVLREGMYTLDVDGGPSFDLYVIPIQTPALGRQDYQAVFN